MALPNNPRMLSKQVLPEFEITCNSSGIVVSSDRICEPRLLRFDKTGRCSECKSSEVEIDFAITQEGVTVWCNRIKGTRFVPVDVVRDVPGHTFIKIKNKGRVFNVPYGGGKKEPCSSGQVLKEKAPAEIIDLVSPSPSPPPTMAPKNMEDTFKDDSHAFLNSITAATHLMDFAQSGWPTPKGQSSAAVPIEETMHAADAQEFMNSITAATHLMDFAQSGGPKQVPTKGPSSAAVHTEAAGAQAFMDNIAEKTVADAQKFMNSIEAATHLLDFAQSGGPAAAQQQRMLPNNASEGEPVAKRIKTEPAEEEEDLAVLQEFLDGIGAATFGLEGAAKPGAVKEEEDEYEDSDASSTVFVYSKPYVAPEDKDIFSL